MLLSSLVSSSICLMLVLYPRLICFTSDHIHCWVWGSVFQREFFFWGLTVFGGTSYSLWKCLWGENRGRTCSVSQDELKKEDTAGVQWILLSEGRKEREGDDPMTQRSQ